MSTLFLLLPLAILGATPPQADVLALDGTTTSGHIVAFTEEEVTVKSGESTRSLPLQGVQSIQLGKPSTEPVADPAAWLTLVDGTELRAQKYVVDKNVATVSLSGDVELEIETKNLRHVRFKKQDEGQAQQWSKALKADAAGDLLVIRKGERIDYLEGVLREVSEKSVEFQLDGDWIPVGRQKVEGLVYSRAEAVELSASRGTLVDRAGSRIELSTVRLDGDRLRLVTPSGVEIARPLEQIERLEFIDENVVYLSDLTPTSVEWQPYFPAAEAIADHLRTSFRPRRDRALGVASDGDSALRLRYFRQRGVDEIKAFARGLAIASRTVVVFELPEDARRFKATVGIDERVAATGHVRLVIHGDDKLLFEGDVSGGESPHSLELDVEGVEEFRILVDYGENYDTGDHLNLCEARIVK